MKKLINIFIFLSVFISCESQTIDSTISLLRAQVYELESTIIELSNDTARLQNEVDSLVSVIGGFEDIYSSKSFLKFQADTFYVFVSDPDNNYAEINIIDGQINTKIVKDSLRVAAMFGDSRRVYFMDGLETKISMIEDSFNYQISSEDWEIKLDKK